MRYADTFIDELASKPLDRALLVAVLEASWLRSCSGFSTRPLSISVPILLSSRVTRRARELGRLFGVPELGFDLIGAQTRAVGVSLLDALEGASNLAVNSAAMR
jgi:hypothetical protein